MIKSLLILVLLVGATSWAKSPPAKNPIHTLLFTCDAVNKVAEMPYKMSFYFSDPEFHGESTGIMTMEMENVHVPDVKSGAAQLVNVSPSNPTVLIKTLTGDVIRFNTDEFESNMMSEGPKFEATMISSVLPGPFKYSCDAVAKYKPTEK